MFKIDFNIKDHMMQKILILFMQLMLCLNIHATNPEAASTTNCDWTNLDFNENLSLLEKVRSNLATGFWTATVKGSDEKTLIQFHESGRVDWITSSREKGTSHKFGNWQLHFTGKTPFLILKNEVATSALYFELERTCNGALLTNQANFSTIQLVHKMEEATAEIKAVKAGLTGNWSNAVYPFDIAKKKNAMGTRKAMPGAFLQLSFQLDGTYFKKYGNKKSRIIEKGEWTVSKNGKYLFLTGENGVSVAKIQHLDLDEVVLEWQLENPQNTDFATVQKSFAFIR